MNTEFVTNARPLMGMYERALRELRENIRPVYGYAEPVMNEGGIYHGIWLESGPHQSCVLGEYDPRLALHAHMVFIKNADAEGFLPPSVGPNDVKTGHIQTVVPFARTALYAVKRLGLAELLKPAYEAAARYDAWLDKYRNRQGTGLVEAACHWDTGHDNSPRHDGQPDFFPDYDTKKYPDCPFFLAPDLSAAKYGGRVALAEMAELLGREAEAARWREKAEELRAAIIRYTYDAEDEIFYDRRDDGTWNKCKSEALKCVLQEHIPDEEMFARIFARHIDNPKEFWTPYPLPSIAVDDPRFTWDFPYNCWGGASQALSALRAPLWLEHYGKMAHLRVLMEKWVEAIVREGEFRQQMNPFSGEFNTTEGYGPAMAVLIDFVGRLYGVKQCADGTLLWGCEKAAGATFSRYRTIIGRRRYRIDNEDNRACLYVDEQLKCTIYGSARLRTDAEGKLLATYKTGVGGVVVEDAPV